MSTPITIVGNLTDDPTLRFTPSGKAVARFQVAVNRRKRDQSGNWVDDGADWHSVRAWGTLAENVAESLTKGTRVVVTGRLESREWQGREGNRRTSWEITAQAVGADLSFATATVTRNQRADEQRRPTQQARPTQQDARQEPPADPWASAQDEAPF
ncbi:single-stranded DNA-binding protein [Propionibacterium freudenreichii]|uniref:single-stranded DNA-binding protein n=1 Tax=Propionibacterium freudenreichii TaxID=1744 RepID=UPI0021A846CA|nr:single-stranded DNA-binding protein [Propionibacterium freudenreichii]MCT2990944.1 single-stranded DNA-binding protein [Propionibacterium freudenreichii]